MLRRNLILAKKCNQEKIKPTQSKQSKTKASPSKLPKVSMTRLNGNSRTWKPQTKTTSLATIISDSESEKESDDEQKIPIKQSRRQSKQKRGSKKIFKKSGDLETQSNLDKNSKKSKLQVIKYQ